jgi:dephospho-CoA kinase
VKVVGLTGGIGSGKSTVSAKLRSRGAVVVDADAIVRELQEPGMPVFERMVDRFGPGIVGIDGGLDRPAVAAMVFNDADSLAALNAIVHPAVGAEIAARIEAQRGTDNIVIADIPLLVEGVGAMPMAGVIVVDTPPEIAVERLVEHRGFSEEDAWARVSSQASREERLARADRVVDNSGTPEQLDAQLDGLWAWMESLPDDPG